MATAKQRAAARRNIKKAQAARARKHVKKRPTKTPHFYGLYLKMYSGKGWGAYIFRTAALRSTNLISNSMSRGFGRTAKAAQAKAREFVPGTGAFRVGWKRG